MDNKIFSLYPMVKKILNNKHMDIDECYEILNKYCNMKDSEKEILQQLSHAYNSKKGLK